jgi:hypothetical protein
MTTTHEAGPHVVFGQASTSGTPEYNPDAGASLFFAGGGILDQRADTYWQYRPGGQSYQGWLGLGDIFSLSFVPTTLASANIAALQTPTTAVADARHRLGGWRHRHQRLGRERHHRRLGRRPAAARRAHRIVHRLDHRQHLLRCGGCQRHVHGRLGAERHRRHRQHDHHRHGRPGRRDRRRHDRHLHHHAGPERQLAGHDHGGCRHQRRAAGPRHQPGVPADGGQPARSLRAQALQSDRDAGAATSASPRRPATSRSTPCAATTSTASR